MRWRNSSGAALLTRRRGGGSQRSAKSSGARVDGRHGMRRDFWRTWRHSKRESRAAKAVGVTSAYGGAILFLRDSASKYVLVA